MPKIDPTKSQAQKILDADAALIEKRVRGGKPMTQSQRAAMQAKVNGIPTGPPTEKNLTKLAARLGITRQVLHRWRQLAGFPKPNPEGSYNVAAVVEFRNANGLKGNESEETVDQKARRIRLQNEKLETEIEILKGAYTENGVIADFLGMMCSSAKAILMQKTWELPALLAGRDIPSIRLTLEKSFDEVLTRFQDAMVKWDEKQPKPKISAAK